ncbi:photosystem II protein, Psb35-related [Baaleninema sp.]|uniref:photosystem II protein, Psb35-related n=1 Tax=Baaleninema sp. TaxID=3101197 RepID=UPI003D031F3E
MALVISLIIIGWTAAAVLGTQAYFRGEQSKPIHERNWNNTAFDQLAEAFVGRQTDYTVRVPVYAMDEFATRNLDR